MDEYHEVHEMQSDVQHNYVVDSDADYTSDSNIIPYDHYVEDNEEHVVQSNVSPVRNDALMSIIDEMHEQGIQKVMELENSQNNALAKLPMLKLGEYEMWEIRIKQYFKIQDYALWEVIENGNSWVPIPITTTETGPSTGLKMIVSSTAEEKLAI
ncbi:hypothetical protein Tco_0897846 [Tanacetum coccineum]